RLDILERLRADGPLPARELPDSCAVPWTSTGWTNSRNVSKLLDYMVQRGEVAAAGRQGRERLCDLGVRNHPVHPAVRADKGRRVRNERRLRALGIARARGPHCTVDPLDVCEAGQPAV